MMDPTAAWRWAVALHTTDALTLIGLVLTILGISVALAQLHRGNKIAQGQSWLALRGLMANYDDIHAKLRPLGEWHTSLQKPDTTADWAKVETYLGLFEYANRLAKTGLLDTSDLRQWYSYRLENILANPRIVTFKLHDCASEWAEFFVLCDSLRLAIPPRTAGLAGFTNT